MLFRSIDVFSLFHAAVDQDVLSARLQIMTASGDLVVGSYKSKSHGETPFSRDRCPFYLIFIVTRYAWIFNEYLAGFRKKILLYRNKGPGYNMP